MFDIDETVKEYIALGFDPIPLLTGEKAPFIRNWPNETVSSMWKLAPADANIGFRCGGELKLVAVDCDEKTRKGTFLEVVRVLSDIGLEPGSYPVIQTASISGRHIYLRLKDPLPGNYCSLSQKIGAGEIRYGPGAIVVAPPSRVDAGTYKVIKGDLSQIPEISSTEILNLANSSGIAESRHIGPPSLSRLAWRLLRSEDKDSYPCRSTATQALLTSLVNSGHDFESILSLFMTYPACGKFKDIRQVNPKNAMNWLRHSFGKASGLSSSKDSDERMLAHTLKAWALQKEWAGRTGRTDRAVYLTLTDIAISAGSLTIAASVRHVATKSRISKNTSCSALKRLSENQYIQLINPAIRDLANVLRICLALIPSSSASSLVV